MIKEVKNKFVENSNPLEYETTLDISKKDEINPPIKQVSQGIELATVICKVGWF